MPSLQKVIALIAVLSFALASAVLGDMPYVQPPQTWDANARTQFGAQVSFFDDFNTFNWYNGSNSGVWQTWYAYGPPTSVNARTLPDNSELEYYSDPLVGVNPFTISNSILSIEAKKTSGLPKNTKGLQLEWTSGLITTRQSFSQTFGYFEMRAQLPTGRGLWPAFWLLPANGQWPPEIDVMEAFGGLNQWNQGHSNTYAATVHYNASNYALGSWVNTPNGAVITSGLHTYGALWTPYNVTFYFDDIQVSSYPTTSYVQLPMYLLANLAVGGPNSWPGPPDANTPSPAHMLIDFIRVYSINPLPPTPSPSPGSSIFTVEGPTDGSTVSGTITITGRAGALWVNIAAFNTSDYSKIGTDVTPSNGRYTITVDTRTLPNGVLNVGVFGFSVPAGQSGGVSTSVTLTLTINNAAASASASASLAPSASRSAAPSRSASPSRSVLPSRSATPSNSRSPSRSPQPSSPSSPSASPALPSTAFTVLSPASGATVSGMVFITGQAGSQWINVAVYDSPTSWNKISSDVTPANGRYTVAVDTTLLPNGPITIAVDGFSMPPGSTDGTYVSVSLPLIVNNVPSPSPSPSSSTLPSTAFNVLSPTNGATVSGTISITGQAGSQWLNIAAFNTGNNWAKLGTDVAPSNGRYTISVDTRTVPNCPLSVDVYAFTVPAGQQGGNVGSVSLTLNVSNP